MQRSGERRIYSQGPWWKAAAASMPSEAVSATRGFVDLLKSLNVSLMLSSRQDSAVLSLSAGASACELSRVAMPAPMGLARRGDRLAVGTSMALRIFQDLTPADPQAAHYLPVASHLIGAVSVHDVDWDDSGQLWFANTQFSALCTTGSDGHFRMQWRPPFVTAPGPVDACHLNGMALDGQGPRFATALAASDGREGWRAQGPDAGVLLATDRADVLRDRLSLPHSPRLHDGALWLLESGAGRLLRLDPATGRGDVVCELPGVLRGLDFAGDHAFIALSRVREGSGEASRVLGERFPRAEVCRVFAVDCRRGATIGHADLPMISEVATLHLHAKPKVVLLEPTPQQVATTLLVDA
jgi:uncharacterized protein (TIGR03032 family)